MYLDYFSLNRHPFRITPDPSLFFPGGDDGRGVILNALIYGITSGEGILKVVGEVGSGKTMLCRMLEEKLPENVEIVYIANPSLSAREILYAIAIELNLDVTSSTERLKVLHLLQDYLLRKHANGGTVVVFIEEAQSMPVETLEEIRLLSNLETYQHKLMQIVLFGQPELDKILAQKNIRQLRERITHSFSLQPLSVEATREYIQYRLKVAGCPRSHLISHRAIKLIAKASSGLTRRINILADKALLAAYADSPSRQPPQDSDDPLVLPRHVRAAIRDSDYRSRFSNFWLPGTIGVSLIAIVAVLVLMTDLIPIGDTDLPFITNNGLTAPAEGVVLAEASTEEETEEETEQRQAEAVRVVQGNITRQSQEEVSTAAALIASSAASLLADQNQDAPEPALPASDSVIQTSEPVVPLAAQDVEEDQNVITEPEPEVEMPVLASAELELDSSEPTQQAATEIIEAAISEETNIEQENNIQESVSLQPELVAVQAPSSAEPEINLPQLTPPVVVLPSGLTELRMSATADWLRSVENKSGYTIQLFSVPSTNPNGLEEYLQFLQLVSLLNDTYICFMPISSANSGRWQVMLREFEGVTPARNLINELPAYVRQYGPYVRNLNGIDCSYPYQIGN